MKIEYQNKPIDWDNAGIMPPQDLIEKGFQPGYKPPAEYFNAILHNTSEAIKEIQEKTVEFADSSGGGAVGSTIIDVTCTYAEPDTEAGTSGEYTITTDIDLQSEDFFCLRFVAPNDYVKDTVFTIGSETYTAVNAGFKENDLVILNFDVSQQKCFFVSGGGEIGDTITTKVVCAGNGTDHKGGIYIGGFPTSYGNADDTLNNSIILDSRVKDTVNKNISASCDVISGSRNTVQSSCIFVLGSNNTADSNSPYSVMVGQNNKLISTYSSLVVGEVNTVGITGSVLPGVICGGQSNKVTASTSIVGGYENIVNSSANLVCGKENLVGGANGQNCVTGFNNNVHANHSIVSGKKNHIGNITYRANGALVAGIENSSSFTIANDGCCTAVGVGNIVTEGNLVCGIFCKQPRSTALSYNISTMAKGDLFVIGNGTGTRDDDYKLTLTTRSNAFRVAYDGGVYGTKSYTASGADYAEMFEWVDGNPDNEDRRGLFVTLDGEKIRPASADDDYILGVVSATPSVVADAQTDDWGKKWKTDIFGERLLDENGAWILNENFREEENENYVSRLDRKEWAAVGLVGKLILVDDGTCEVNGYCVPANGGIATKSETGYRVLSRVDENHIKVLIK